MEKDRDAGSREFRLPRWRRSFLGHLRISALMTRKAMPSLSFEVDVKLLGFHTLVRAHLPFFCSVLIPLLVLLGIGHPVPGQDLVSRLQSEAIREKSSPVAHWGDDPLRYSSWTTHSNRLIPVYTYGTRNGGNGIELISYTGENSVYRDQAALRRLYRSPAEGSLDANAEYMDQTNIFDLQLAALTAGRKHIFLVVFDGLDWQTTRATAIWNTQQVSYDSGRGTGTFFQDYQANGTTEYGWMVTSPYSDGFGADVDTQEVSRPAGELLGGYSSKLGGLTPWSMPKALGYLIATDQECEWRHAYTDSAGSATSMTAGIKTYYGSVNIDPFGSLQTTIAHRAQLEDYRIGVVTNVPISHATPGAAYAHNVHRYDYQDISRDLLGLPSINHRDRPLAGLDVLIGAGWGVTRAKDSRQGKNFVPGNPFLTEADMRKISVKNGGPYVIASRTPGRNGKRVLMQAAELAIRGEHRLLGFFGVGGDSVDASEHLPYASADGDFQPAPGISGEVINYTVADITENPSLADMTKAAISVLSAKDSKFWMMVEPGDVDWANHSNNLDASIGAVNSGDDAVRAIAEWVEENSSWEESLMIVTGDHGHYLFLDRPELLIRDNHHGETDEEEVKRLELTR